MKKRLIFKLISAGFNCLLALVLGIIVPRVIGPEAYGNYSYVTSTYAFFFQFLLFSSNTAYIYFLSSDKYKIESINAFYFSYLFLISIVIITISLITLNLDLGLLYVWNNISDLKILILGLCFGILLNFQQRLIEYSDSKLQTIISEKIRIVSRMILASSVMLFVFYEKLNIYSYFTLSVLSLVIFIIGVLKFTDFRFKKINRREFILIAKDFYIYVKPLVIFSLVAAVYSYLGKYVLQATSGSKEQGYYNFAFQITMIPVGFIYSIMTIFLSEMTKKFKNNDIVGVKKIFNFSINKLFAIHAIISFFLLINAIDLVRLLVGEPYVFAVPAIQVLSIFSLFNTLGMFSSNIYFSSNRNKLYGIINTSTMFVGILSYIIFFYFYKLNSYTLSIVVLAFYTIRVIIQLIYNLNYLKIKKMTFFGELSIVSFIIISIIYCVNVFLLPIYLNFIVTMIICLIVNYIFKDYLDLKSLKNTFIKD
tara:strand:+ start:142 stop:1578 length:1437 start_codon:yes stop_codon:yes gene_type:complete